MVGSSNNYNQLPLFFGTLTKGAGTEVSVPALKAANRPV